MAMPHHHRSPLWQWLVPLCPAFEEEEAEAAASQVGGLPDR